jgi:hypothetical protein
MNSKMLRASADTLRDELKIDEYTFNCHVTEKKQKCKDNLKKKVIRECTRSG